MPSSSVETKIREALMYQLSQITVSNGFHNDLSLGTNLFEDFIEDPYGVSVFPTLSVIFGNDTRSHYDNDLLYVTQKVWVLAFVDPAGADSVIEQIEKVKQDVHLAVGTHPGLQGSGGGITCQLAVYASAEPFGRSLDIAESNGLYGVKIGIDITYQQLFANPTEG